MKNEATTVQVTTPAGVTIHTTLTPATSVEDHWTLEALRSPLHAWEDRHTHGTRLAMADAEATRLVLPLLGGEF